jgi:hypothetical protein
MKAIYLIVLVPLLYLLSGARPPSLDYRVEQLETQVNSISRDVHEIKEMLKHVN